MLPMVHEAGGKARLEGEGTMRIAAILLLSVFVAGGALTGCRTTTPGEWEGLGIDAEDARIQSQIMHSIRGEPSLARFPIQVNVVRGVVTLSGTVGGVADSMRVYGLARAVPGVVRIENRIVSP